MWELTVITVGKVSDEGLRRGVDRYAAMTGGEWRVRLEHVPASRGKAPAPCRRQEGLALLGRLPKESYAIALDPAGETMDSPAFARALGTLKDSGRPVAFLVGGAHGLDPSVLQASHRRLSLSEMTLPHEMATLVLMEQIYRAYARYSGRAYAK